MVNQTLARSPAGPIEAAPNLKRRQRSFYWRQAKNQDGVLEWMRIGPLPSDPVSKEIYLSKGFRLTNPNDEPVMEAKSNGETERLYGEIAQLRQEIAQLKKHNPKRRRARKVPESSGDGQLSIKS